MKFVIRKIILWPKDTKLQYRTVTFEPDKINVITGASRTGKSAIIPIIDYCLASDRCTIPVDTIRNKTEWFGVLVSLDNEELLICRKEPGTKASSGDMFLLRGTKITIPKLIESNTNVTEIKNILNELLSMSFLALEPSNRDGFSSRPSYRDFMAFIFQPQNIVANADVMFYKADTMEHRQKLINLLPYALGAVTPQVLAARQELERTRKLRERLQRDLAAIKDVADGWKHEITAWLVQAKELGLIKRYDEEMSFDDQIFLLSNIVESNENESFIQSDNIKDLSSEILCLRKEEQEVSTQLFALQKRYTEMLQLKDSLGNYEDSLKIQVQRLEISNWLKQLAEQSGVCPFCNHEHIGAIEELESLCKAITYIEKSAESVKSMPAAFERELHYVQKDIDIHIEKLNAIRNRLLAESGNLTRNSNKKYTLSGISRFLGRMEASLQTLRKIGNDSELENRIAELTEKINELAKIVNEHDIRRKMDAAIKYINQTIGELIKKLDVEHPDDPVEFVHKELTVKVKNSTGHDDYLWEIGSASNWLAYHIATILAFQKYFQIKSDVSVPSFVILDQPSQVYFPQRVNQIDETTHIEDEDKEAVRKIFTCMDSFLSETKGSVQIIVTEHADDDIWGGIDSVHLVERWRGENKLIPQEWV